MKTSEFLQRVLPDLPPAGMFGPQGCYFALGISPDNRRFQQVCVSISDVIEQERQHLRTGMNSYMALGSFGSLTGGRKKENAVAFKCFWADIDAGKPTSKYANAKEALAALIAFTKNTGLAPSLIVSSGCGLHVYWCLDKNLAADKWLQVAHYFKCVCDAQGLDVDPARACDLSSVLRLPGSMHMKTGNVVSVLFDSGVIYTARSFLQALMPFVPSQTAPVSTTVNRSAQQAAMAACGMGPDPVKDKAERVVRNCPQILTMGLASEPQWYQAMSVLKRCVDGREWAHKLSAMDSARYNPADTDAKFDHAPEAMPCTCASFEHINPELCLKCRFHGLVKSPIRLANHQLTAEAQPVPSPVPEVQVPGAVAAVLEQVPPLDLTADRPVRRLTLQHPQFSVDHRGVIYKTVSADSNGVMQTVETIVLTAQLYYLYSIVDKGVNDTPERAHMFEFVFSNGHTERRKFSINEHYGPQQTLTWFANAKAYLANANLKPGILVKFMDAYLSSVATNSMELETHRHFGWDTVTDPVTKERTPAFLTGPGLITSTGLHPAAYAGPVQSLAERNFTVKGTLNDWKEVPRMYRVLDQKAAQLAICMSFAAPLMKFANGEASSAIFSLWSSESGVGKSGVLRACASVWGNPAEQFISREASSVARSRSLAALHNLPAFMDEMTDVPEEDMYGLAYTLTGGKEKNKLRSSGEEFVETGSWSTVSFLTSNKSFKSVISKRAGDSNATLLRIMEYECDFKSYESEPQVNEYILRCLDTCKHNYGHAGAEFIYQLLQHPVRLATLNSEIAHWIQSHGFSNNERFMSNSLALALKAGRWAVEWGLLDYDMDALEDWVTQAYVPHNRVNTEHWSADAVAVFTDYLMARQRHTVIVAAEQRDSSMPDPGQRGLPDKFVKSLPVNQDCMVRYAIDDRKLTISKSDFTEWCTAKRRMSPTVILRRLGEEGIQVKQAKGSITTGIPYAPTPVIKTLVLDDLALDTLGYIPAINIEGEENV